MIFIIYCILDIKVEVQKCERNKLLYNYYIVTSMIYCTNTPAIYRTSSRLRYQDKNIYLISIIYSYSTIEIYIYFSKQPKIIEKRKGIIERYKNLLWQIATHFFILIS